MQIASQSALWSQLENLQQQAETALPDDGGGDFSVALANATGGGSGGASSGQGGPALSGAFNYQELTAVGKVDPSTGQVTLFPNASSTPDGGKQMFADALQNFMSLAAASSQNGMTGDSTYQTSGSFVGNGGAESLSYSGSFTLTPPGGSGGATSA